MSVVKFEETFIGLALSEVLDGIHFVRETQRKFNVDTSGDASDVFDVLNHVFTPAYGDAHPDDSWMTCQDVLVSHVMGKAYLVTANYKSIGDPAARAPEISYSFESTTEPIDSDISDNPMANTSDEPLDPHLEEEFFDRVISYSFYSTVYNYAQADDYIGSVNSDIWATCAVRTVRIVDYSAVAETIATITYYKITIVLKVRKDTWDRRYLDQGFRTKDGTSGDYSKILDADGEAVADPVLLNGSGQKLANGADPVYLTSETKKTKVFASLPIVVGYL